MRAILVVLLLLLDGCLLLVPTGGDGLDDDDEPSPGCGGPVIFTAPAVAAVIDAPSVDVEVSATIAPDARLDLMIRDAAGMWYAPTPSAHADDPPGRVRAHFDALRTSTTYTATAFRTCFGDSGRSQRSIAAETTFRTGPVPPGGFTTSGAAGGPRS